MRAEYRLVMFGAMALFQSACFAPEPYQAGPKATTSGGGGGDVDPVCAERPALCQPAPPFCHGSLTDCLFSDALLARYFIGPFGPDQPTEISSSSGKTPTLTVVPADDFSIGESGMRWTDPDSDGRAEATLSNTDLMNLDLASQVTIEVVLDAQTLSQDGARVFYIGQNPDIEKFTLILGEESGEKIVLFMWHGDEEAGKWRVDVTGARHVLHLVLDTSKTGGDAALLYIDGDGERAGSSITSPVSTSVTLDADNDLFVLGNRDGGRQNFMGTLYYAAVYRAAFTSDQVAGNAALLAEGDDGP